MANTTIKEFPKLTKEQLDMHVVSKAIVDNLASRCSTILYYQIEFEEDEPLVQAYADRLTEIDLQINILKPETMERVIKNLKPLLDKLSLEYILSNPDGYKSL